MNPNEQVPEGEQYNDTSVEFPTVSDLKKRAMLKALRKNLGIVSSAAKAAGIHRDTHYAWMKDDKVYKDAAASIVEDGLDFAESKLFELINGVTMVLPAKGKQKEQTVYMAPPNVAATIFYLKTKGKHRGYIERVQLQDLGDDEVDTSLSI